MIPLTPTWLETFEELHSAATVDELWGVLVSWHGIRSSSVWEEPYGLFCRFHRDDSEGAGVTAALLCTDHRWRRAAHHLILRLTESGLLAEPALDELAEWFLTETFDVELVPPPASDHSASPTAVVARPVWPPLRRWSAQRLVRRHPDRWSELLEFAKSLSSRDGVAVVAGVMDAADQVAVRDRPNLIAVGLTSGSGIVRLAALPALAKLAGPEVATERARSDPSAKVWAWKPAEQRRPSEGVPAAGESRRSHDEPGQPRLF